MRKHNWLPHKSKNDIRNQFKGQCSCFPSGVKGQLIKVNFVFGHRILQVRVTWTKLVSCVALSRSFKRLSTHLFTLVFIKTQNVILQAKPGLGFHLVSLKSRNVDKVALSPRQNNVSSLTLPHALTDSPCPCMTRGLSYSGCREIGAQGLRVLHLGLLLKAEGHWLPLECLDKTQKQAPPVS